MAADRTDPPPLPAGLRGRRHRVANELNTTAIHALRRARVADAASGLTPERLSLLSVLVFAGPMPMSRLAAIEGVSAPAITRIVTALETDGLVTRQGCPRTGVASRCGRPRRAGRSWTTAVAGGSKCWRRSSPGASAEELAEISRALATVRRALEATR